MAALPLYVHLPKFYGDHLGVPLASLGFLLLALRLVDGVLDPLLGAWSDRARSRKPLIASAVPVLALGMVALFAPPVTEGETLLLAWLAAALFVVYLTFSLATINHGAWGAELSSDPTERTRITAAREGLALVGVVIASVAPGFLGGEVVGLPRFAWGFAAACVACAAITLWFAPDAPHAKVARAPVLAELRAALSDPLFARLLTVFMVNGIASAPPATLVLFFVADVLRGGSAPGPLPRASTSSPAPVGMPLWVRLSARVGKVRAWHAAMLAADRLPSSGPRRSAQAATPSRSHSSASCLGPGAAAPTSRCRRRCSPTSSVSDRRRCSATGAYFGLWTLGHQAQPRGWPPASRCRSSASSVTLPGSRDPDVRCARLRASTPACRASSSSAPRSQRSMVFDSGAGACAPPLRPPDHGSFRIRSIRRCRPGPAARVWIIGASTGIGAATARALLAAGAPRRAVGAIGATSSTRRRGRQREGAGRSRSTSPTRAAVARGMDARSGAMAGRGPRVDRGGHAPGGSRVGAERSGFARAVRDQPARSP